MRIARTITALAVTPAALIALALPATAASASTPVLYGRGNGWHDPARRPTHFFTGQRQRPVHAIAALGLLDRQACLCRGPA